MIITKVISRSIWASSVPTVTRYLESAALKRLPHKKLENIFSEINVRNFSAYDADGKTIGFVINKKSSNCLLIGGYRIGGFVMATGVSLEGPMILFPHSVLSWNVRSIKDVNEDALVLFKILEPKIDILVLGYGDREEYTPEVKQNFTKCCKNLGLRFEALPTKHAVGTFNFLAEERRLVAGAFIPPSRIDFLKFAKRDVLDDDDEDFEAIGGDSQSVKLLK